MHTGPYGSPSALSSWGRQREENSGCPQATLFLGPFWVKFLFSSVCWVRRMPQKVLSGCPPELQGESPMPGQVAHSKCWAPCTVVDILATRRSLTHLYLGKHLHPSPILGDNSIPFWKKISPKVGNKLECPLPAVSTRRMPLPPRLDGSSLLTSCGSSPPGSRHRKL